MKPLAVEVVVADTGPLIALARLQLLDLPIRLFRHFSVTATVLAECQAKPDRGEGQVVGAAIDSGWIELCSDPSADAAWGLDVGETSAIAWAVASGGAICGGNLESNRHEPRNSAGCSGIRSRSPHARG